LISHIGGSQKLSMLKIIVGAKHYLDFELKEPQIDAMVDVAAEEEAIDEIAYGI
jgi:histidinol phosphatase-like PHP family hydrolase